MSSITRKQIYIIKHFNTSTIYGLSKKHKYKHSGKSKHLANQSIDNDYISIPCFYNKEDAIHVMKSIVHFRHIHSVNPSNNTLCVLHKKDLIDTHMNFDLYVQELNFKKSMNTFLNRNIGICLIEKMYFDDEFVKLNSIEIVPFSKDKIGYL